MSTPLRSLRPNRGDYLLLVLLGLTWGGSFLLIKIAVATIPPLSVVAGHVCSVLPGALVDAVRGHDGLEALPLTSPVLTTPIGFMSHRQVQPTRALDAALALSQDREWLQHAAAHSGLLAAEPL